MPHSSQVGHEHTIEASLGTAAGGDHRIPSVLLGGISGRRVLSLVRKESSILMSSPPTKIFYAEYNLSYVKAGLQTFVRCPRVI
jgi:hypothetical protein